MPLKRNQTISAAVGKRKRVAATTQRVTAAMIRDACRRVGERVAGSRSQRHGNADPVRERETPLRLPMWIIL
jgi:hypothetical protein